MCGGKQEAYDKVKPILEIMGSHVRLMGDHGAGTAAKLVSLPGLGLGPGLGPGSGLGQGLGQGLRLGLESRQGLGVTLNMGLGLGLGCHIATCRQNITCQCPFMFL